MAVLIQAKKSECVTAQPCYENPSLALLSQAKKSECGGWWLIPILGLTLESQAEQFLTFL